jgi:hypothetical protein
MLRQCVVVIFLLLMPSVAVADCFYNGKHYAEGDRAGAFVCEKGRWVRR